MSMTIRGVPYYLRCQSSCLHRGQPELYQRLEKRLFASLDLTFMQRSYSATFTRPSASFQEAQEAFVQFHEFSNIEKAQRIFIQGLESLLTSLGVKNDTDSIPEKWDALKKHLERNHSYYLPSLTWPPQNYQELLDMTHVCFRIVDKPLIKGNHILQDFDSSGYISTVSEFQWRLAEVRTPFEDTQALKNNLPNPLSAIKNILDQCSPQALPPSSRNLSKLEQKVKRYSLLNIGRDAAAATLLATPHICEGTFLREVGCWHGQNLISLLFYAALQGKSPRYYVGTDINSVALSTAESLFGLFGMRFPFVQLYLSNALESFDFKKLEMNFDNEIKLALRVVPVLDPNQARDFLLNLRKTCEANKTVVIVSYAVPEGETYDRNLKRVGNPAESCTKEEFSGGVTFRKEFSRTDLLPDHLQRLMDRRTIFNTYYTEAGFSRLVQECGFRIGTRIVIDKDTDNTRVTALLLPQ